MESINILCIREEDGVLPDSSYKVSQVFIKNPPAPLYHKQRICELQEVNSDGSNGHKLVIKAMIGGNIKKLLIKQNDIVTIRNELLELEVCQHTTMIGNTCANCGVSIEESDQEDDSASVSHSSKAGGEANKASVSMLHSMPHVKVSIEAAQNIGKADRKNLLSCRKLVLLVDLDQTLVHTTHARVPKNMKDVHHFRLQQMGAWYHTKLRPHTHEFLRKMNKLFELHICTYGTREYAEYIAKLVDPTTKLFEQRILSRNEFLNPNSKTNNLKSLFPCGDQLVCIIDDRADVWGYAPNVIQVVPYNYFENTGDINAPPHLLGAKQTVKTRRHRRKSNNLKRRDGKNEEKEEGEEEDSSGRNSGNSSEDRDKLTTDEVMKTDIDSNSNDSTVNEKELSVSEENHSKSEVDTPKSEVDTPKSEVDTPKSEVDTPKSEVDTPKSEVDTPKSEVDTPKSEVDTPKSEVDTPKSDVDTPKSEVDTPKSEVDTPKSEVDTPKSEVDTPKSEVDTPKSEVDTPKSEVDTPKSEVDTPKSEVDTPKSEVDPPKSEADPPKSEADPPKSEADTPKSEADTPKSEADTPKSEADTPNNISEKETRDKLEDSAKISKLSDPDNDLVDIPDNDDYLIHLETILSRIHSSFYDKLDKGSDQSYLPDVKSVIPAVRKTTLSDCHLVMSGMVPHGTSYRNTRAYSIAASLGASVSPDLPDQEDLEEIRSLTHMVAADPHTVKVRRARTINNLQVVTPDWLWECMEKWQKVNEAKHVLSADSVYTCRRTPPEHVCLPHHIKPTAAAEMQETLFVDDKDKNSMMREVSELLDSELSSDDNKSTSRGALRPFGSSSSLSSSEEGSSLGRKRRPSVSLKKRKRRQSSGEEEEKIIKRSKEDSLNDSSSEVEDLDSAEEERIRKMEQEFLLSD